MSPKSLKELSKSTRNGIAWTSSAYLISTVLRYLALVFLARLLGPGEFGLMAGAMLVINVLMLIKDLGLGGALVQRQGDTDVVATTIFVMVIISSTILAALAFLLAPAAAVFFRNNQVTGIIKVLSGALIIRSMGVVPGALIDKSLQFSRKFWPEVISGAFEFGVPVALGLLGYGVWSLVYGQLAAAVSATVLLWLASEWRPKLNVDWRIAKEVFHFGKYMVSEGLLRFLSSNVDNLIVGKVLGLPILGLYTMAFRVVTMPTLLLSNNITRVTFPAFSLIQTESDRLAKFYLRILRYVWFLVLPLYVGLFALAPTLVTTVLGAKWRGSIAPLQALIMYGILTSLIGNTKELYMSVGKPRLAFMLELARIIVLVPLLFAGAQFGLLWVALAQSSVMLVLAPFHLYFAFKIIGRGWSEFGTAVVRTSVSAAALLAALLILRPVIDASTVITSGVPKLLSLSVAGVATYSGMTLIMERTALFNFIKRLRN